MYNEVKLSRKFCSDIGGQAVIEGVMMRGKSVAATAVRNPEGKIEIESERFKPFAERSVLFRIPFVRGVLSFGLNMVDGIKYLTRAGEVFAGGDVEPTKTEKWFSEKLGVDVLSVVMGISAILGVLLALALFVFLPQLITTAIFRAAALPMGVDAGFGIRVAYNAIAGVLRMIIFLLYLAGISLMKDVKRLFKYHGAEHKTISCFEKGLDMTVENARKMTTVHERCGTTFMFLVMLISILFFMLFPVDMLPSVGAVGNFFVRLAVRIACIPIIAGVSYEVLKWTARYDNVFTKIVKAPGLWLQKLTTKEPDDDMLEVAIAAFTTVKNMQEDESIETTCFDTSKSVKTVKSTLLSILGKNKETEIEVLMMDVLGAQTRTELYDGRKVSEQQVRCMKEAAKKMKKSVPVQYASGKTVFYGREFTCDQRALIPRLDTEILADEAVKTVKEKKKEVDDLRVLELCTGSGIVAITVALECGVKVTATDVSADALSLAKENAGKLGAEADIDFRGGNMFSAVKREKKYDVIICNPPYVAEADMKTLDRQVLDYEPRLALYGGYDGLDFYRVLAENAERFLQGGGVMLLEVGDTQADEVERMFEGYTVERIKDLNTPPVDRVLKIVNPRPREKEEDINV